LVYVLMLIICAAPYEATYEKKSLTKKQQRDIYAKIKFRKNYIIVFTSQNARFIFNNFECNVFVTVNVLTCVVHLTFKAVISRLGFGPLCFFQSAAAIRPLQLCQSISN